MNFRTQTSQLKEILKKLGIVVSTKAALPVVQNVLVTVSDGKVLLTTTDLLVTVSFELECETNGTGQVLIPYTHFKNIIDLESGEVQIESNEESGPVVQFDADIFRLGYQGDPDEFPKTPKVAESKMLPIDIGFIRAFKMAALSVNKDPLRPALNSVMLELRQTETTVVSTDANSIYWAKIPHVPVTTDEDVLLPTILSKILESAYDDIEIGFNTKNLSIKSGALSITCKRVEAKFPTWRAVVPEYNANVTVKIEDLEAAVSKAYVMSDYDMNGIDFFISPEEIKIETKDELTGMSCNIKIESTSSCEVKHIRFNGRLFKRLITQLESKTGDIQLSISGPNKAMTAKIPTMNAVTVLLMPIQLHN